MNESLEKKYRARILLTHEIMEDYPIAKLTKKRLEQFNDVRAYSERLCSTLDIEDFNLQITAETSPLKWHLAHTSWFYETFILKPFNKDYCPFDDHFEHLFNSYYNGIGQPFLRPNRHILSRPNLETVYSYRHAINEQVISLTTNLLSECSDECSNETLNEILNRIELGIQHEKQHQELMLSDIKYNFFQSPLLPAMYDVNTASLDQSVSPSPLEWIELPETIVEIGCHGESFSFDNERPRHKALTPAFAFANRLVNNEEFLQFVEEGGYRDPQYWMSDGWTWVKQNEISSPLYWIRRDNEWYEFSLYGLIPLILSAPVCHINLYEADAFARWSGNRLPTEFEWERAVAHSPAYDPKKEKQFEIFHPVAENKNKINNPFNAVWQWTQSSYSPYPGFKTESGAIGEYNGKFMCNQSVLKGGSCFSPPNHTRHTYRNFFYSPDRWQMTGIRLAREPR